MDKIFNKCKKIDFGTVIYKTREDGEYIFLGVRDKRRQSESVLYSIPNRKTPKRPNVKGIQKDELEKAWVELTTNGVLTKKWFKTNLPACDKEGGCNFKAIGGLINIIHPNLFVIEHGKIKKAT